MPPFTIVFPVKMTGPYDGVDAKGRHIHFPEAVTDGQLIGNLRKSTDPAPPFGRARKQANGAIWIVEEKEVQKYYNDNKDSLFTTEAQIKISHILVRYGDQDPTGKTKEAALEKMEMPLS